MEKLGEKFLYFYVWDSMERWIIFKCGYFVFMKRGVKCFFFVEEELGVVVEFSYEGLGWDLIKIDRVLRVLDGI